MSSHQDDIARVVAEGFFQVYVKEHLSDADRQEAIANLASVFRSVFAYGRQHRQLELAAELLKSVGNRTEVPAQELLSLVSSLRQNI